MKNSLRSLIAVITVFSALSFAGTASAAGPVSKLYLTAGDQQMIWVVQGTSVVNSWSEQHQFEYPLAVSSTIRTLGRFAGEFGSEYTLAGAFTGTTYAFPFSGGQFLVDGTTDTTSNYSVDANTGDVYSFSSTWTNPTYLFTTSSGFGDIAYDSTDNSLWLASFAGNTVEHRSLFGTLISSFTVPFSNITCLAVDPADNTLWMGSQGTLGTFYQYSKSGTALGSVFYPALSGQNTIGGEFQAVVSGVSPGSGKYLEVNGQGKFNGPAGKPAFFAFSDVENQPVPGTIYVEGVLGYQDKGSKIHFQTGKIFSVTASGNEAYIRGNANFGSKTHPNCLNFTIYVIGNQNPSTNDFYSITLSNGYTASGNLINGFISITPDI
jgi:hypothetical protein